MKKVTKGLKVYKKRQPEKEVGCMIKVGDRSFYMPDFMQCPMCGKNSVYYKAEEKFVCQNTKCNYQISGVDYVKTLVEKLERED